MAIGRLLTLTVTLFIASGHVQSIDEYEVPPPPNVPPATYAQDPYTEYSKPPAKRLPKVYSPVIPHDINNNLYYYLHPRTETSKKSYISDDASFKRKSTPKEVTPSAKFAKWNKEDYYDIQHPLTSGSPTYLSSKIPAQHLEVPRAETEDYRFYKKPVESFNEDSSEETLDDNRLKGQSKQNLEKKRLKNDSEENLEEGLKNDSEENLEERLKNDSEENLEKRLKNDSKENVEEDRLKNHSMNNRENEKEISSEEVTNDGPKYIRDHAPVNHAEKSLEEENASLEENTEKGLELSPDGDRVEFQVHGHGGPKSYIFGFDTGDGKNRQFRLEERLSDGTVKGHYGFYDARGKLRTVQYTAKPIDGYQEKHHESNGRRPEN